MYRYAEGTGNAALFDFITDIDFLSSTELICTDHSNHCLRLVDLSQSPPETSTFAGNCTVSGNAGGHRLDSARFNGPWFTEVSDDHSFVFVLDQFKTLFMIDMKTDNVTTLLTIYNVFFKMKLFGNSLLYIAQIHQITLCNINTREVTVVVSGHSNEGAVGSFEHTKFRSHPFGLLPWRDEVDTILLVAEDQNFRFAGFFYDVKDI